MQPLYFVKALDGQYSEADPQPLHRNPANRLQVDRDRWRAIAEQLAKFGGHLGGCADPFTAGQLKCD